MYKRKPSEISKPSYHFFDTGCVSTGYKTGSTMDLSCLCPYMIMLRGPKNQRNVRFTVTSSGEVKLVSGLESQLDIVKTLELEFMRTVTVH